MSKSDPAVPETPPLPPVIDYEASFRRLQSDRQDWDNRNVKERFCNDALKDKMESARRNIEVLTKIMMIHLEKGVGLMMDADDARQILIQNVKVLAEINKFKC